VHTAFVDPDVLVAPADRASVERLTLPVARMRVATRRWMARTVLATIVDGRLAELAIDRTGLRCGHGDHGRPRLLGGPEFSVASAGVRCRVSRACSPPGKA
jgi:hypothetical protein